MATRFEVRLSVTSAARILLIAIVVPSLLTLGALEVLLRERTARDALASPDAPGPPVALMPYPSLTIVAEPVSPLQLGLSGNASPFHGKRGAAVFAPRLDALGGSAPIALGSEERAPAPRGQAQSLLPGGLRAPGSTPPPVPPYAVLGLGPPVAPQALSFEPLLQYALAFWALGLSAALVGLKHAARAPDEN